MSVTELLEQLSEKNVRLSLRGDDLVVQGKKRALAPSLLASLRENKDALIALIRAGEYLGPREELIDAPPNLIPHACAAIAPEMLTLIALTQDDIERIVSETPGGAANIQDIYPLAPLQEGILFHHLISAERDPYVLRYFYSCDTRARLDDLLKSMQSVIDRHDILRTAVMWEGLSEPAQVVLRQAPLIVEEISLDPDGGGGAEQLHDRFDPRRYRFDIRRAPLMRALIAYDARANRWLMLHLFHHLAGDHTAMEIMRREVMAHLLGQGGHLPAPSPFRNFVAQARLGVSREEHESFFRKMLGDVEEPTAPFGLTDVHDAGSYIEESSREVDASLAGRLRERARNLGVSAASLCHLAWAQTLARTSGRDDVVFGTVLFGRMLGGEGADRALGMFINTLPARIRIGNESAEESVRRTHSMLTELLRHEHAPLALAQRCSATPAPAPLFTSFLNYRHSAAPSSAQAGLPDESMRAWDGIEFHGAQERANYPLCMNVDDLGEGFALNAQARSPIDPERICAYMHTALESLVEALERVPTTPARDLDVLPRSERERLLVEWNATETGYPSYQCVHELFEAMAAAAPDAMAVAYENAQLTYRELNIRANRLARYLIAMGVAPDARVALSVERSLDMIVALLAILKAGGAYVPLDPAYPAERLTTMIEDSAPVIALTQSRTRDEINSEFAAAGVRTINLETDAWRWAEESGDDPDKSAIGLSPEHLAYVIYTSGSTGRPKGVMNEHRGVVNRLLWMQEAYGLGDCDTVLQKTPFGFDVSVWEFFWPLMSGARLVVARPEGHKDPEYLASVIRRERVTTAHFVPSMLQAFLDSVLDSEEAAGCSSLTRVICSGESLPGSLVGKFQERLSAARLYNLYGPTEAAVDVTSWTCPSDTRPEIVPIGRPIANTKIYLLDGACEPAPVGAPGEIHIGGTQVARGYLNRPELTAERFVACPFAAGGNTRMYRTGDLGRYQPDGNIEFLGRNDFQVKIRGMRIELGEIEARLAEHPSVREAVVMAREDTAGDKRLVAYYTVGTREESIDAESLRTHIASALPEYMTPAAYVALDKLPLSSNGKLDRKSLPAPDGSAYTAREYEAPAGETEIALARIWADELKLERVGRHDNFFELGGHSLFAVKVISRMRREGLHADVNAIFAAPTLAALAVAVGAGADAGAVAVPPNLIPSLDQNKSSAVKAVELRV